MAMQQYNPELEHIHFSREDNNSLEKHKSVSARVDGCENTPSGGGFDCNICLDSVQDPVVTLCGHLYCWPCIYKWIHYQSVSAENLGEQQPQCPVCKAEISEKSLVPLYGRGLTTNPSDCKPPHLGIVIPRRPPSPRCGSHTLLTTPTNSSPRRANQIHHQSYPQQPQGYHHNVGNYAGATPILGLDGTTTANALHPVVGMFGEMVYARIFGNSETLYSYPDTYNLAGSGNPRVRRHVMQADKSLSRVCFFLCCCVVSCLVLF
ncbi:unnamed protein product [Ilex paraguariensis]|uniref:E3 ubiquitin-protein ligase RMA n=1 Tax=Ilex paraguariensis TaxID=185542 RepID=A0ABC8U754_9AQUA